ncbi:MAG TPA: GNAT family N-acetyltransferase [Candidatus Kapabacteria bacterium]|jgi:ribosomal-protein-alanine N-acetyltransferase|nr:GNAT family N-acetyltransferase [Ignavibacteria bacterium]HRE57342.1 GNAT family N-acetyltransferase [Candidatus Kapabacteria bacterium]
MKILETSRLVLREFTVEDAAFLVSLMNSSTWMEFIGNTAVHTIDHAEQYIVKGLQHSYTTHGFGLWLVENKLSKEPIGMCGLLHRESLEYIDIGFAILPQFQGYGFAFEIAASTMIFAKHILGIETIAAITKSNNIRSKALLEKLGLSYQKNIRLKPDGEELQLYL